MLVVVLINANNSFFRVDRSNKGHILGVPRKSIAERDLSSATVSLLRIILHSAMLGSAGREPEVMILSRTLNHCQQYRVTQIFPELCAHTWCLNIYSRFFLLSVFK